jgi:hypothetical protein
MKINMENKSNYCKKYIRVAEKLLNRKLNEKDGISNEALLQAEKKLKVKLPISLLQYYQVVGNIDKLNRYHNIIYNPKNFRIIDKKLVFMEENQSTCYWGINLKDLDKDDPIVFQGQIFDAYEKIDWYSEKMTFSRFMTKMLVWEFKEGNPEDKEFILQSLEAMLVEAGVELTQQRRQQLRDVLRDYGMTFPPLEQEV